MKYCKNRYNTWARSISLLLASLFIINQAAYAAGPSVARFHALQPTSRVEPIVQVKEEGGKVSVSDKITDTKKAKRAFYRDAGYITLNRLIAKAVSLGLSRYGLMDLIKAHGIAIEGFDFNGLYMEGEGVRIPFRHPDGTEEIMSYDLTEPWSKELTENILIGEDKKAPLKIASYRGLPKGAELHSRWEKKRKKEQVMHTQQIGLGGTYIGVIGSDSRIVREFIGELVTGGLMWKRSVKEDLLFVIGKKGVNVYTGKDVKHDEALSKEAEILLGAAEKGYEKSWEKVLAKRDAKNAVKNIDFFAERMPGQGPYTFASGVSAAKGKSIAVAGAITVEDAADLIAELKKKRRYALRKAGHVFIEYKDGNIAVESEVQDEKAQDQIRSFAEGFSTVFVFSDVHAAGKGEEDNFGSEKEIVLIAALEKAVTRRSLVVINGDFLELWQEKYGNIKRCYRSLFNKLRQVRRIVYIAGNHDEAVLSDVFDKKRREALGEARSNKLKGPKWKREVLTKLKESEPVRNALTEGESALYLSRGFEEAGVILDSSEEEAVFYVDESIIEDPDTERAAHRLAKLMQDARQNLHDTVKEDLGNVEIVANYLDEFRGIYLEHGHAGDPYNFQTRVGRFITVIVGWIEKLGSKLGWKNVEGDLLSAKNWVLRRIWPSRLVVEQRNYIERALAVGKTLKWYAAEKGILTEDWTVLFGHTHIPVKTGEGPLNAFLGDFLEMGYCNTGTWSTQQEDRTRKAWWANIGLEKKDSGAASDISAAHDSQSAAKMGDLVEIDTGGKVRLEGVRDAFSHVARNARVMDVREKEGREFALVEREDGSVEEVEMERIPEGLTKELLRDLNELFFNKYSAGNINGPVVRKALGQMLVGFETMPKAQRPVFYTFPEGDRIESSIVGAASVEHNMILLHRDFIYGYKLKSDETPVKFDEAPLLLFHEIGEYLVRSGDLELSFRGHLTEHLYRWGIYRILLRKSWGKRLLDRFAGGVVTLRYASGTVLRVRIKGEALSVALKEKDEPHYLLRALQRYAFPSSDNILSWQIKTYEDEESRGAPEEEAVEADIAESVATEDKRKEERAPVPEELATEDSKREKKAPVPEDVSKKAKTEEEDGSPGTGYVIVPNETRDRLDFRYVLLSKSMNEGGHFIYFYRDGQKVGHIEFKRGYLADLRVEPDCRGNGYSRSMFEVFLKGYKDGRFGFKPRLLKLHAIAVHPYVAMLLSEYGFVPDREEYDSEEEGTIMVKAVIGGRRQDGKHSIYIENDDEREYFLNAYMATDEGLDMFRVARRKIKGKEVVLNVSYYPEDPVDLTNSVERKIRSDIHFMSDHAGSRIAAVRFADAVKIASDRAAQEGKRIIVAIDTKWIPEEQAAVIQPLINEMCRSPKNAGSRGNGDRIIFVRGKGSDLALDLHEIARSKGVRLSDIVVIGEEQLIRSKLFDHLKSTRSEKKALLVGVDAGHLRESSFIRIIDIVTMALRLMSGEDLGSGSDTVAVEGAGTRMYIFLPRAECMEFEALKRVYEVQKEALMSA